MNTEIEVGVPKFVRNIIIGLVIIVLGLLSTCTLLNTHAKSEKLRAIYGW